MTYPQIFVRAEKAGVLENRHPWIWDRSIIEPTIALPAGSIVDLIRPDGVWVGRGIYNPESHIRVRIYQWQNVARLDEQWLCNRLAVACDLRDAWQQRHDHAMLDAVRLVNSEGDGLSGLVIERFGNYAVVQVTAAGVQAWLPAIAQWLTSRYQLEGVLLRVDEKMAAAEGMQHGREVLAGHPPQQPIVIQEYDVQLKLDLVAGQKTGYYLDQRANRREAASLMRGQMLDVCTYLGGFALAACKHGAVDKVTAIDMSATALGLAAGNAALNGMTDRIEFVQADCFEELDRLRQSGQRFDSIVLDPPRLAGSREHKPAALRAYHRLNQLALQLLQPGGFLVTCSCSGRVTREEFMGVLAAAARRAGKRLQIIAQRGADFDHPWDVACPESEYLKCVIARADA